MDVMKIIKLTMENYKQDGLAIMINGISLILQKAIQTPVVSNISDNDRQILQCNQNLTQLIYHSLDLLGPAFIFNAPVNLLTAILEWLMLTQIPSQLDKKNATLSLKTVKLMIIIMRGFTTSSTKE